MFTDITNLPHSSQLFYPGQDGFGVLTTPRRPAKDDFVRNIVNSRIMLAKEKRHNKIMEIDEDVFQTGNCWSGWVPLEYSDPTGEDMVHVKWKMKISHPDLTGSKKHSHN